MRTAAILVLTLLASPVPLHAQATPRNAGRRAGNAAPATDDIAASDRVPAPDFTPRAFIAVAAGAGINGARTLELRLESRSSRRFTVTLGADLATARATSVAGVVNPNAGARTQVEEGDPQHFGALIIEPALRIGPAAARATPYVGVHLSRRIAPYRTGSELALVGGLDVRLSARWAAQLGLLAGFVSAQNEAVTDNAWTTGLVTFRAAIAFGL